MDDQMSHFITVLGDTFAAAALADLSVEVRLQNGSSWAGKAVLTASNLGEDAQEADHTGYRRGFSIDGERIDVEDVVSFGVRLPLRVSPCGHPARRI